MRDVASKVPADDDVPRPAMICVKDPLDLGGDFLRDIAFFEGRGCDLYNLLLQALTHIGRYDMGLGVSDAVVRGPLRCGTIVGGRCDVLLVGHDEEGRDSDAEALFNM